MQRTAFGVFQRRVRMRNKRADTDHVGINFFEKKNIVGIRTRCLPRQPDQTAGTDFQSGPPQVLQTLGPGLPAHSRIKAFNDEFYPIYVEEYADWQGNAGYEYFLADDEDAWMNLEVKDPKTGKARVTVHPLDPEESDIEERTGYVFVFPKALYDKIAEDPENEDFGLFVSNASSEEGIPAQKELRYEYTESNLLMNFIQKKQKESGGGEEEKAIEIISQHWESYGQTVECTEITGDEAEPYKSEWQAAKVFTVKASTCRSVRINVPFDVDSFAAELNKQDVTDTYCAATEDGTTTAIDLWNCQDIESELTVVIRDAMWQKVTVLLVRP